MTKVLDILKKKTLVFLDLETTGLDFSNDKIIEIGAVKVKNNKITETFHTLVNPQKNLPFFITHLTGITQQELEDKPVIDDIKDNLLAFLDKHWIVCHNASFEKGFLSAVNGKKLKNIFIDTCELTALLYPVLVSYSLENLLRVFKVKNNEAHRALTDAEDTYKVWQALFSNVTKKDLPRLKAIQEMLAKTKLPAREVLNDLISNINEDFRMPPVAAESEQAQIIDSPPPRKQKINFSVFKKIFSAPEKISENLDDYEVREEQLLVCESVTKAFNEDKYLAVEAGTGIGKSLAYLLPALSFSLSNAQKVVISTNTKNLQDQLIGKDIPLAKHLLDADIKTAVVKGRDNYLCLKRVDELIEKMEDAGDEARFAAAYLISLKYQTKEGQLDEISPYLLRQNKSLAAFKRRISSQSSFCLKDKCPHYTGCFYQKMIKRAEAADVLIANHSLIFSQPQWLPVYSRLILDEAHNIENAATTACTQSTGSEDMQSLIIDLRDKRTKKGFYFGLVEEALPPDILEDLEKNLDELEFLLENFTQEATLFFREEELKKISIITKSFSQIETEANFSILKETCAKIIDCFERMIENLFFIARSPSLDFENKFKASGFAENVEERARIFKQFFMLDNEERIKWLEAGRRGDFKKERIFFWRIFISPLTVDDFLNKEIFSQMKTAVLISATLKVGGDFSFFSRRAGLDLLDESRVIFKSVGSPFDFQKNVILGIPKDFPVYNHFQNQKYLDALAEGIKKIVLAVRGKNLALFSSKQRMMGVYKKISRALEQNGILTLCQNLDGSRHFLIRQLKEAAADVFVLGSKSFQEGVDISGLSVVFMDKLSFPNRQDPIISARRAYLMENGKNPFEEYELPLAVIALRQGFGRLMRKKNDFGLVVIFDSRILKKDYKDFILKSLPQSQIVSLEGEGFYSALERKFEGLRKDSIKN